MIISGLGFFFFFFNAIIALKFLRAALTFNGKGVYCSAHFSRGMRTAVSKSMYTKVSLVPSIGVQFANNSNISS